MKIAHCQFEPWAGDFEHNLARFEEGLKRADAEGAKIVSFPECFFTGYPDTEDLARKGAFAADSPQMQRILDVTARHAAVAIAGFNELRGSDLYNTVVVAHHGQKLGLYSKCAAYQKFHKQGRDFPVWEIDGLKFGVLICADGGYIEPARILALKGARIIFAPHFNYISDKGLISHFMKVRADHAARACENSIYFVRGNNVVLDPAKSGITRNPGIGYGDSYVMDPHGEILVQSRRHQEDFITAEIDPNHQQDTAWGLSKSAWSYREFAPFVVEAMKK
ncbi:carbon-nitrogen hydrolase family protein [Prosthecobacter sp.]|jgi:predicted amidohydrolase|uniref:carbon-nitrogen hydrolase family protein n=1 Tax=Prosthecobacter sp. TaxID=1965333 RepID=UPI003784578A